jgi:hypothetical protein
MNPRKYLLGLLSEKQQQNIEETFFTDEQQFEKMLAAEEDLVEAYINNDLSSREKKQFETLLMPQAKWRQRVATVKALKQVVHEEKAAARLSQKSAFSIYFERGRGWLAALLPPKRVYALSYAVMLLFVATAGFYTIQNVQDMQGQLVVLQQQNKNLAQTETELRSELQGQTARTNEVAAMLETEQQQRQMLQEESRPAAPRFYLQPGVQRDAEGQKRLLLPDTDVMRLELLTDVQLDYAGYRAVVKTVSGFEVWSSARLDADDVRDNNAVVLELPTTLFGHEDYLLTLRGVAQNGDIETIYTYFFSMIE